MLFRSVLRPLSLHNRMSTLDRHIEAVILSSERHGAPLTIANNESDYFNGRKSPETSSNSSDSLHHVPKRRLGKSSKVSPHIPSPTQGSSPQHRSTRNGSHESLTQGSTTSAVTVTTTVDVSQQSPPTKNSQRKDKIKNIDIL